MTLIIVLGDANGVRLLSYCEAMMFKVMSTTFPHKNIHKETWAAQWTSKKPNRP